MFFYCTKKAATLRIFLMMHFASSTFSLSNRIPLRDRLTFSPTCWSPPTRSSTQAESERSKCFKIAAWPHHRGGAHTLWVQSCCTSPLGIVRIHKRSAETWRPLWLLKTHNALCCCCELLTAWAGPRQQRAAPRSRQRGGILDISPWWQPCYYSVCAACISSVRISCGNIKSNSDDKYFPGPSVSVDSTQCSPTWAWAELLDACWVWVRSSGSLWTCLEE